MALAAYASLDVLPLPMPEDRLGGGSFSDSDAAVYRELVTAPHAELLQAPADPDERAFYRWVLGHHAALCVWRLLGDLLEDMLRAGHTEADMAEAAAWYDGYSVLLFYAGSCSSEVYARVIRSKMASIHPAFSGIWARDYERVMHLMTRLAPPAHGVLRQAAKHNRLVHMTIAKTLVPFGESLLKEAGLRPGHGVTDTERDTFDSFFLVRREPVSWGTFCTNMTRKLAAIQCDLAASPELSVVHPAVRRLLPHDPSRMIRDIATALEARRKRTAMELDKRIRLTPRISDYVLAQAEPPIPAQQWLIDTTTQLGPVAEMQIPHEQGVLLTLLAKSINAATVIEVGTFTGYSTLALARGLAPGGRVHTYDISDKWAHIATRAWKEANVVDRIQQHFGPATTALADLPETPIIDLAFIDADKPGYIDYWEQLVPRMRPGGLILADNVLYAGEVADDTPTGNGLAIKEFNTHVRADNRVESVLLTIADGLTIARKKS